MWLEELGWVRELPGKLMIGERGLSPLSDGQSGASCHGRSLGCPHKYRMGAVTELACSLGQLREGTSWVMLVAQPLPPVLLPIHICSCPPRPPWEKNGALPTSPQTLEGVVSLGATVGPGPVST